jgi:hypothetical protein
VDFALYGGLVPGNLEDLEELAKRGVAGFKAFMFTTGTIDFQPADDLTLYEGMAKAAELGLPVLVHPENKKITGELARRAVGTLRTTMRDYLDSRPVVAELEAINRAILLAEETGCSLHVVHVSTGRGIALVAAARAGGGRYLRDLRALPRADRRRRGDARGGRKVCPAATSAGRSRISLGPGVLWQRRIRHFGPLAVSPGYEGRRRSLPGVGRHRGLLVATERYA